MSSVVPAAEVQVQSGDTEVIARGTSQPVGLVRSAWERWKQIAHAIGVVQTRLLMILFFFVVAFPLGLVMRLSGDKLRLKPPAGSNWTPHPDEPQNLEAARRQY